MTKLVAYKEKTWLNPNAERQMWGHLARSYGLDWVLISDDSEVPTDQSSLIIIDEDGDESLEDFEHPLDAIYLIGKTHQKLTELFKNITSVRIDTPNKVCLFGISAASILLEDRRRKLNVRDD